MPFDGIVTKCMVDELSTALLGGRIDKVFQPETDEIYISIRSLGKNYRLVLSANASYPRIHLTESSKENPSSPPLFCMVLRKHIAGGKITGFEFHDYERMIGMSIDTISELGDPLTKKLIIEIMGKHSNIMLLNEQNIIIDSIKHVDNETSGVREVMPARPYAMPPAQHKLSIDSLDFHALFFADTARIPLPVDQYLLSQLKGFSPLLCREICSVAAVDPMTPMELLSTKDRELLLQTLQKTADKIKASDFSPCILYKDEKMTEPFDFHCLSIRHTGIAQPQSTTSLALDKFFTQRDRNERLKQKKSSLFKTIHQALQRCNKKISLHEEKLRDVANRETLKLYGELITANIHVIPEGVVSVSLVNYYTENSDTVNVPMDENLSPQRNAQRYYKKYAKAKSAYTSTLKQLEETRMELLYMEGVSLLLENSLHILDIDEIKLELTEQGYTTQKKKTLPKKNQKLSSPMVYKSSEGYEIFVGKNNRQNDQLTLKIASSNDLWLHTRNIPGSHVIIRKQIGEIPDATLLEAALLAAWFSKARFSSNVPVDYTAVRHVKKPSGAKPGMVIYDHFKTLMVTPEEAITHKLTP